MLPNKKILMIIVFYYIQLSNLFAQVSLIEEKTISEFNYNDMKYEIKSSYLAINSLRSINREAILFVKNNQKWLNVFHRFDQVNHIEATIFEINSNYYYLAVKSKHGVNTTMLTIFKMYYDSTYFSFVISEIPVEMHTNISSNTGHVNFDGKVVKLQYTEQIDDNRVLIEKIFYIKDDILKFKSSVVLEKH